MTISRIILSLALTSSPCLCLADLNFVTQDKPPFNYLETRTGKVAGLSVDILREAASRAKVTISHIDLYPMIRSIDLAQNEVDTCVFPVVRTAERKNSFKWVGPFANNIWVFYARNDFKGQISTLEDARKFSIGSDPHSAKTDYLKSQGFHSMDLMAEDDLNARKLSIGRFDLWLVGLYDGKIFADQAKVKNIKSVFDVKAVEYYLACNKHAPDAEIEALDGAIKSMQKDGTIQRITDAYASNMFRR